LNDLNVEGDDIEEVADDSEEDLKYTEIS